MFLSVLFICLQHAQLSHAMGKLSPGKLSSSDFLPGSHLSGPPQTPAEEDHAGVAAEVAMERTKFTETGRSQRERELLANMGRLEDQLEGYRRLAPSLQHHMEMQAESAKRLQALEAKALHIEEMAGVLWWDSKMLMCAVALFGGALCVYAYSTRQCSPQEHSSLALLLHSQRQGHGLAKFDAAAPKNDQARPVQQQPCEFFSLAESPAESPRMPEEQWWTEPSGPRPAAAVLSSQEKPADVEPVIG